MKAPEKLYLHPTAKGEVGASWLTLQLTDEDVEYVRTDVFIEKVENYLKNQFIKDVSVLAGGVVSISFNTAISNLKNYMKG